MEAIVTNENIEQILASEMPVLIDFWATWCGPCRQLAPTVEEIAEEYDGKVLVCKCNVDDADEVAMRFRIRNIPTLVFAKGGEAVERTVGLVSKSEIKAKLDSLI